jgi:hypothetical protein
VPRVSPGHSQIGHGHGHGHGHGQRVTNDEITGLGYLFATDASTG